MLHLQLPVLPRVTACAEILSIEPLEEIFGNEIEDSGGRGGPAIFFYDGNYISSIKKNRWVARITRIFDLVAKNFV